MILVAGVKSCFLLSRGVEGLYERVTLPSGVIEHKFYVGNAVITKRSNNAHDELYLHKDNQGSTISISNSAGSVLQQFIYDPWGRQYSVSTNSLFSTYSNPGTSKWAPHFCSPCNVPRHRLYLPW
jgi:hypothetical protein